MLGVLFHIERITGGEEIFFSQAQLGRQFVLANRGARMQHARGAEVDRDVIDCLAAEEEKIARGESEPPA